MPRPTMLQKSKIKILPHYTQHDINRINTISAKEYLMSWFAQRIPSRRGGIPMIKGTSVNDRVMILKSGTGSGKSTTLGPELYIKFYEATTRNIAVTQPRILTAMSIPEDIVGIYDEMKMGINIGYQTGDFTYKPKSGVVFMTVGILAQQLKVMTDDDLIKKYAFIVIDECHDRSLEMDLALSLVKKFIHRNYKKQDCPFLILTSATFDTEKYAKYFGVDKNNIVSVEGLNYPIEQHFPAVNVSDYVQGAVDQALKLHKNVDDYKDRFTDILIFVYGAAPSKEIAKKLNDANEQLDDNYVVIELSGRTFGIGDEAYRNIFKPLTSITVSLKDKETTPTRRIIVSTNVAETGVTIDTLKYLIDTGFENSSIFNPIYGSFTLYPKCVTMASAVQRKGRVGRRAPGAWYPLYTKETFDKMQPDKFPDLITTDMSSTLLGLMVKDTYLLWDGIIAEATPTGKFDIKSLDLLDYPTVDSISYAVEKLFVLGLIDSSYTPTSMGLAVTSVTRMDMELVRMILAGYQYGANILDLITIASFMSLGKRDYIDTRSKNKYTYETLFKRGDKELQFYDKFFIADDFIECLFIWDDFMEQIEIMKTKLSIDHVKIWCKQKGLKYEGLLHIVDIRDELIATFIQSIGLDPYYNGSNIPREQFNLKKMFHTNINIGIEEVRKIKQCIYEGYRLNMATFDGVDYVLDTTHERIKISSSVTKPVPQHDSIIQTRPKKIIVREIDLKENMFSGVYQFEAERISSMDGFVDVDETFIVS